MTNHNRVHDLTITIMYRVPVLMLTDTASESYNISRVWRAPADMIQIQGDSVLKRIKTTLGAF